jgi:aspartate-semialdehyde dehydrogenase
MLSRRIPVAVLGATGVVGQRLVQLLHGHPWFEVVALAASERSAGRRYGEACAWRLEVPMPREVAGMTVREATPDLAAAIVFSALDAKVAGPIERACAAAGLLVVSNAACHRMDPDVPLLVPEVNPEQLELISVQRDRRGWSGAIVTNPNCSTATLVLALAPLARRFGLEQVVVTTLQAVSGAGYPGVASLDILANVFPHIPGEEEKIESETRRILGTLDAPHPVAVSATATRVPVLDGHCLSVSVRLTEPASEPDVHAALAEFAGEPQRLRLPSAPARAVVVRDEPDRPQPRMDAGTERGMSTVVGRLRRCAAAHWRFVAVGHNTVRGAAGAALLNAELLVARGLAS